MRINMNRPELYNATNNPQRQSTLECLKEFGQRIKWKNFDDTAIDLGCGDGSVSVIVKNYAPHENHSYKKFVACDVNENMIKFANKYYANECISFRVVDLEVDIPKDLIGAFNHVFSFYALQWVKNQEKAFSSIYNLLTDDGDIFLTLVSSTAIYSVYKALSQHPKWKDWLKEVNLFVSPYHEMQNPVKRITKLVENSGFKNVDVQFRKSTSIYDNVEALKYAIQSVEPFNMPQEVFDELYKDYCSVGEEIGVLNFNRNSEGEAQHVTYEFTLIIIIANKLLNDNID